MIINAEYFVIRVETCYGCGGKGIVTHPQWAAYFHETKGEVEYSKWFAEHGCTISSDIPPEEIDCSICNGKGNIETRVPLRKALIDLDVIPEMKG